MPNSLGFTSAHAGETRRPTKRDVKKNVPNKSAKSAPPNTKRERDVNLTHARQRVEPHTSHLNEVTRRANTAEMPKCTPEPVDMFETFDGYEYEEEEEVYDDTYVEVPRKPKYKLRFKFGRFPNKG